MTILDYLIKENKITELQKRDINLSVKNGDYIDIDDAINSHLKIDYKEIASIRSFLYNIPLYNGFLDYDPLLLKYFNEEESRKYKILPIKFDGTLLLGIVDPEIEEALYFIHSRLSSMDLKYVINILDKSSFVNNINKMLSSALDENKSFIVSESASATANIGEEQYLNLDKVDGVLDEDLKLKPVEFMVDNIIKYAVLNGISDIHIEPRDHKIDVRMRIDGILKVVFDMKGESSDAIIARFKILSNMRLDERRKPQDGRFSSRMDGHKIDFRASVLPSYYGEKVVVRILDSYRGVKPLSDLGFSGKQLEDIRRAIEKPFGLILISGPTGSGKTTTLYSMLNEIDRKTKNVISLEDPIEYNLGDMTQSQIFPEIGYTFASGLRSILRQDPDVIMVGEIRDAETANLAIQAALTGHLVLSTIHTNNAAGIIPRLQDMGVDNYLIAPTLCLAIAQRLVSTVAPSCAVPMQESPANRAWVEQAFKDFDSQSKMKYDLQKPLIQAVGNETYTTGLKGRMPVVETIYIDDDFQNIILKGGTEEEIFMKMQEKGILNIKQDSIIKCLNGKIPFSEINGF